MGTVGKWAKIKESTWALRLPVHQVYIDNTLQLRASLKEKFPNASVQRHDVFPSVIRCGFDVEYEDIIMTFNDTADEAFFMVLMSDFIS